ncbi:MAG: class I SAM-dependent methyltransferase [Actinobacteria bacterium]|nr:class I SAM-dependent methyltransferase [Actinomycetota bacterium]
MSDREPDHERERLEERLHWIYSAADPDELRERYDTWADSYDHDLDGMQWLAPRAAAGRCAAHLPADDDAEVLDAGCGTGLVGVCLRSLGAWRVVGFDLSRSMLERAAATGVYAELSQGSLLEPLPFESRRFAAVVSVGVFTHGHVGPAAFAGLARVVRPGGHVSMTFRDDAVEALGYRAESDRLESAGVWTLVERTDPEALIQEGSIGADMRVWTWRVS